MPSIFNKMQILPQGAIANRVKSVYSKDGKNFWLTLAPSGLAMYNTETGRTLMNNEIPGMASLQYSALITHMSSIAEATDGSIWLANNSYGVVVMKDGKPTIYNNGNCQFVKDNYVKALHRSRSGIMFVGERHHLN